jgi:hypothetical protein
MVSACNSDTAVRCRAVVQPSFTRILRLLDH